MRREKLLEVAFYKFAEKGYNTTLSEIANGAGIKKQSIYNHFKNKDDLLFETIKIEISSFYSNKLLEINEYKKLNSEEALRLTFFSICDYYKDINKLKFWRWILLIESEELFINTRDLIRENESKFYSNVKEIIQNRFDNKPENETDTWEALQTFVVMVHGILDAMLLYNKLFDSQILIQNTWNYYCRGLMNNTKN